jgi:hypothetical protein
MHGQRLPVGLGTKTIGADAGEVDLGILLEANMLSRYSLNTLRYDSDNL